MKKEKAKNIEFIEFIENAEGTEMPVVEGLRQGEIEVAKIPNANRAQTARKK